jgi:hypothetical protein
VYYPETGIFVNGGEKTFTAEGLTEPQLIDLADDVTVTFSGVTPDVYVSREINWEAPYIYSTSLADDYDEKLYAWNGDKYEFDVTYDAQELLLMGYVVSNAHVETQISGLNSYMITAAAADDPEFEDLWDAYEEEARREIRSQGNYILDRQEEHGQWIVWSDSVLQRERVQVQYASSLNEGTGNGLYLVTGMILLRRWRIIRRRCIRSGTLPACRTRRRRRTERSPVMTATALYSTQNRKSTTILSRAGSTCPRRLPRPILITRRRLL